MLKKFFLLNFKLKYITCVTLNKFKPKKYKNIQILFSSLYTTNIIQYLFINFCNPYQFIFSQLQKHLLYFKLFAS